MPDGAQQLGSRAFTVLEALFAVSITAVLALVGLATYSRIILTGNMADSAARLRTVGQAILLYTSEHDQRLPGPLWPGQVMLYDPKREGRIVRDLADYLGIAQWPEPYLVERMIPRGYRNAVPGVPLRDVRIYVVNPGVAVSGKISAPFGSLTESPPVEPMTLGALQGIPASDRWMIAETDQQHPYIATAPWRASTPIAPLHQNRRATMRFDGSLEFAKVP